MSSHFLRWPTPNDDDDGAISGRNLFGHQVEPSTEVPSLAEHVAGADRRHRGAGDDGTDARHRHQPLRRTAPAERWLRRQGYRRGYDRKDWPRLCMLLRTE